LTTKVSIRNDLEELYFRACSSLGDSDCNLQFEPSAEKNSAPVTEALMFASATIPMDLHTQLFDGCEGHDGLNEIESVQF